MPLWPKDSFSELYTKQSYAHWDENPVLFFCWCTSFSLSLLKDCLVWCVCYTCWSLNTCIYHLGALHNETWEVNLTAFATVLTYKMYLTLLPCHVCINNIQKSYHLAYIYSVWSTGEFLAERLWLREYMILCVSLWSWHPLLHPVPLQLLKCNLRECSLAARYVSHFAL